jgi:hypothetical protein
MEVGLYTALAAPVAEWNGRGGKGAYRDGGMIAALHSPSPSPSPFVVAVRVWHVYREIERKASYEIRLRVTLSV